MVRTGLLAYAPLRRGSHRRERTCLRRMWDCVLQPRILAREGRHSRAAIVGAVDHLFLVPGTAVWRGASSRAVYRTAGRVRGLLTRPRCARPFPFECGPPDDGGGRVLDLCRARVRSWS